MFEQETEQLIAFISKNTIADLKSIGLRTIFESNIPLNVKTFFKAEVEWLYTQEHRSIPRSSHFQYDHPDIQALQKEIDTLLIHNYIFSKQEFESVLDKCVHFLFNFLCRPQWTLVSFLCESKNVASSVLIQQRFRYCKDYPYYSEVLKQYLIQRNINTMTYEQIRIILGKIDHEITRNHSPEQLAEMTQPLYDFIAAARISSGNIASPTAPTRALMYFFEDKGMAAISESLKQKRDTDNRKEFSIPELSLLIQEIKVIPAPAPFPTLEPQAAVETIVIKDSPRIFGEDDEPLSYAPVSFPEATTPPKPNTPLFSIEEERAIVKTLFQRNESLFHSTVTEILSATNWNDAALIIDRYFSLNDIEPFCKEAITLTNILQSKFLE